LTWGPSMADVTIAVNGPHFWKKRALFRFGHSVLRGARPYLHHCWEFAYGAAPSKIHAPVDNSDARTQE